MGILFLTMCLIVPSFLSIEKDVYLEYDDSISYTIEMDVGNELIWSFETYNDSFQVIFKIGGDIISSSVVSDSGIYKALFSGDVILTFRNSDINEREGNIYIELSPDYFPEPVSPETEDFSPIYIFIIFVSVVSALVLVIYFVSRPSKKTKQKYRLF